MSLPTGRFRRSDRLRHSRDYRRVSSQGRRAASSPFVVLAAPSRELGPAGPLLGITASRKVGSAVVRNRVKRCVREWFRRERPGLPERTDWVVIARRDAAALGGAEIGAELTRLASQLAGDGSTPRRGGRGR